MTIPTLKEAIDAFRANDVGTIIRLGGVNDLPKTKDGKTLLWAQMLGDPARVRTALQKINTRCRQALEVLQSSGGEVRTARYRSLLERAGIVGQPAKKKQPHPLWGAARPEEASDATTFEEILATLLKYGLIWTHTLTAGQPGNAKIGFEGGRFVYIPKEVAAHLPPLPPQARARFEPAHVISGSARVCQRDLYLFWSAARDATPQVTNAGLLRVGDLKRIAPQLLVSETITTGSKEVDYRRFFFLRRLLTALGLLQASDTGGTSSLQASAAPAFFGLEATRRVQASFQAWRDGAWWNELWNTRPTQAQGSGPAEFAPKQVSQARQTVLETLTRLAQSGNEWIAIDMLSDLLHDSNDEFLIERGSEQGSYNYYYQATSPYTYNSLGWIWPEHARDEQAGWEGVEAVFIRSVLAEGLYWLGLLDLGYLRPVTPEGGAAPDGLAAVRLTEMGRWLLLDGPRPQVPQESGRVVVQPNFRIFAFDPISDNVLAQLDTFATRLNAERAVEYELSRESVYRAQQAGRNVTTIRQWLESVTGAALPQNIARTLEEWGAAFNRIVVRPRVGWIQAASPELADAVLADPDLSVAIIKRVTPTALLVHAALVDEVEARLLALSELPARTSRPEDARPASITVAADGTLAFTHAAPSLYLYGYLRAVAGLEGAAWRVSPASVARARAAGLNAPAIIAELEALALGGVPAELQRRIKAWAKHYGDATAEAVTVVKFRDQAALDELLADPDLKPLLQPFYPEARLGLAAVDPAILPRLTALLAERGVVLTQES